MRTDKQPAGPVELLVSQWCPNVGLTPRGVGTAAVAGTSDMCPDPDSLENTSFWRRHILYGSSEFPCTSIPSWLLSRTDRNSRCPAQKCLPSQIVGQAPDPGLVCKNDLQFCKIHSATRYQTGLRNSIPSGTNLHLAIISTCIFLNLERQGRLFILYPWSQSSIYRLQSTQH